MTVNNNDRGRMSPSLADIDICICESLSQSSNSDIAYVDAISARTTGNTVEKLTAAIAITAPCNPCLLIVTDLNAPVM